jgi:hypothetical protein
MWLADVEATLPMYNSIARKDEREERFGKAIFGHDWIELTDEEINHIRNIRAATTLSGEQLETGRWHSLNGSWTNYDPPLKVFYGDPSDCPAAQAAWKRFVKRKDQLAHVRELLRLLDLYGRGQAPNADGEREIDPLERVRSFDERDKLERGRDVYWLISQSHSRAPIAIEAGPISSRRGPPATHEPETNVTRVPEQGRPETSPSTTASPDRKRGRKPKKLEEVKRAMRRDIQSGRHSATDLAGMLEKNLASEYGVSRDTARRARTAVLSEMSRNEIATNDK